MVNKLLSGLIRSMKNKNPKLPATRYRLPNKGFTLLEMLVSVGIITSLVAVFLVNYRGAGKKTDLIMSAQKMVTDIRLAQNNTLGSVKYGDEIPLGGWGVRLDLNESGSYFVFADLNENSKYDAGEDNESDGAFKVNLPDMVRIEKIQAGGSERNTLDIVFVPPDPTTVINYGSATSSEAIITLKEDWEGSTRDVYFNFFGLIEAIE